MIKLPDRREILAVATIAVAMLFIGPCANLFPDVTRLAAAETQRSHATAQPKPATEFVPTGNYETREIEGWTVRVNKSLLADRKELGDRALRLLEVKLYDIRRAVPARACGELQKVPIWLGVNDGHAPCAEYHPSKEWLTEHGYNPDKAKAVEIGNAERFIKWSADQPAIVLHELTHAYHDQVLGFDHAGIKAAYERAVESKKYDAVLHHFGKVERAYALTNEREYLAEATEAFFVTNDFYPFVRAELRQHDPEFFRLLEEIWLSDGLGEQSAPAPPTPRAEREPKVETVRVAGIVLKWVRGDKEANFRRVEPLIREAAARGAQIVCTTECFLDGYAIADKSIPLEEYRSLGEAIPPPEPAEVARGGRAARPTSGGPYYTRLASLAGELKIHLVAGMTEADGDGRYNSAVLIGPDGKLIGKYRKQKLEHEAVRNTAGSESGVFDTPFGRLGIMICADRREPDIVRRICDRGADFLICPSGGMFGEKSNDPIVQARSRENQIPIVFVHPAEFLVTGPDGSVLARTILGDSLVIAAGDIGGEKDQNRILYFDLPLRRRVNP